MPGTTWVFPDEVRAELSAIASAAGSNNILNSISGSGGGGGGGGGTGGASSSGPLTRLPSGSGPSTRAFHGMDSIALVEAEVEEDADDEEELDSIEAIEAALQKMGGEGYVEEEEENR